ncbi:hypothetical protein RB195_006027 [Necator americanus]|uniref:Uncharacterized protein n=1 Tax=Necator americanus TaxID=51031 RepID=A0ABR1BUH6_NECAM
MTRNIYSFEQLITRTSADEKMWSNASFDNLVAHVPTSGYEEEEGSRGCRAENDHFILKTLEPISQRGAARAAGNQELTSELARLCRKAIKEDLKERRAEVLAEAGEAGKSIRYTLRKFANRKRRMRAFNSVETVMEALEALDNQGVPTQYIKGEEVTQMLSFFITVHPARKCKQGDREQDDFDTSIYAKIALDLQSDMVSNQYQIIATAKIANFDLIA